MGVAVPAAVAVREVVDLAVLPELEVSVLRRWGAPVVAVAPVVEVEAEPKARLGVAEAAVSEAASRKSNVAKNLIRWKHRRLAGYGSVKVMGKQSGCAEVHP